MITAANKGKTLIYIYYNRETKPETLLASRARDGFAKVMLSGDVEVMRCRGKGLLGWSRGTEDSFGGCHTPHLLEGQERNTEDGETALPPPSKPGAKGTWFLSNLHLSF